MLAGVQHDLQVREDYLRLKEVGISTARDGVRWHLIDKGGSYDFSSFLPMLEAAVQTRTQVIWNLCHYGWPDDLDVFSPQWVDRFARFCAATARVIRDHTDDVPFYCPINEISFLCWAATRSLIYPHALGRDPELKLQLVRGTIAACEALWSVDPRARIVYSEPLIHVVAPRDRPDWAEAARNKTDSQFEAWDILRGRQNPEIGGAEKYLDILGVNFYHSNQWEHDRDRLRWEDEPRDPRWVPLHQLMRGVWERYQRPLVITETSHFGSGRARWIREIAHEVAAARAAGVPVEGVCLYPILDRFDWEDRAHWHNSGLWDLECKNGFMRRVLNREYAGAFAEARTLVANAAAQVTS